MLEHKLKEKYALEVFDNYKSVNWRVELTTTAKNCKNYIRNIVDNLNLKPNPEKPVIALSVGDPTVYGNLKPAQECVDAVIQALNDGSFNGYSMAIGLEKSRNAVAEYLSFDGVKIDPKDVILCSGCSSALETCVTVLADRNQNILLPRPAFLICRTIAESIGVNVKYYNLLPERKWEADLDHLEEQIDANTAAIVLINPSNPCGSVYSEEHLRNILEIAYRHRIPIIADEIYERIVFPGKKFVSVAALHTQVPILVCGGLSKRFLVPGWRFGWIVVYDNDCGAFQDVRKGLVSLSQRTMSTSTLIQGALPNILANTPQWFHDNLVNLLSKHAQIMYDCLQMAPGLVATMPEGAMYMLVEVEMHKFPQFENALEFAGKLMEEESVFCLPGEVFTTNKYFFLTYLLIVVISVF